MNNTFTWYDLNTTDTAAAQRFYCDVVGWDIELWAQAEPPYAMFKASTGTVGGVRDLPEAAAKMGAPAHWIAYVQVPDCSVAVARIEALGGATIMGPMAIPSVGTFAVCRDPQGATFCPFQPETAAGTQPKCAGNISWMELTTSDHAAAWDFYSALLDWEVSDTFDMGPENGEYRMFKSGDESVGGMWTAPAGMPIPPNWLPYFEVEDLDAAVARAKSGGANLVNGPMEVPGGSRMAQLTDPQGAMFALHQE